LLVLVAFWAYADSGRESKMLPPLQVELKSGETWAFRVKNSSGTVIYGVDSDGKPELAIVPMDNVSPTYTSAAGFTITAADGNIFEIDCDRAPSTDTDVGDGASTAVGKQTSGVTVTLPTIITTAMDGQLMTFIKTDTATTGVVLWAGATATSGVSIENATGVTNDALIMDAQGDTITLIPSYTEQIYFIQGSRIQ